MRRSYVWLAGTAAAVIAVGSVCLATRDGGPAKDTSRLAEFSDQGVTVTVSIKNRSADHATLVATFAPDRAGFHLYSINLPPDGIQGVGRPTSLVARGRVAAAGPLTAEARETTLTLAGTDLTLPVYPDGPVTVDLPVHIVGQGEAAVVVGYAACSKSACLPPVSNRSVNLALG